MPTLHVCFLWHMHQPSYRDPTTGTVIMPWVRLHALKDYTDMAHVAELVPEARVTFNWVPGLCDQLDAIGAPDYPQREAFWRLSERPADQLAPTERAFIRRHFFSLHPGNMLEPWPRYRELRDRVAAGADLSVQELRDLQVWFNLAWCGEVIKNHPALQPLLGKGQHFDEADKRVLFQVHREAAAAVLPRYARLAQAGQIELTCSPYYHPILPLLVDTELARRADPSSPLPATRFRHPADAQQHLARAHAAHAARFGQPPAGLWPSEGSVAPEIIPLVAGAGFRWFATDEAILMKSVGGAHLSPDQRFGPWTVGGPPGTGDATVAAFFRHHELSDLIGFTYAGWPARRAAEDFVGRLQGVRHSLRRDGVVTVALDGENCWETYPGGVTAFLPELYRAIARAPDLRLSTFTEALDAVGTGDRRLPHLPHLGVGSWIDGTFRTWMGDPAKNRGWELLTQARDQVTQPLETLWQTDPALAELVMRAEASDWFWWLGEGHSSAFDAEFDALLRAHCAAIYTRLGRPVPETLRHPIEDHGAARATDAVHPPLQPLRPPLDGRCDSYYRWISAGRILPWHGAIHRAESLVTQVLFGFDDTSLSLRVDTRAPAREALSDRRVRLELRAPGRPVASVHLWPPDAQPPGAESGCDQVLEARVPAEALGFRPGQVRVFDLTVVVETPTGEPVERFPAQDSARVTLPAGDLAMENWYA